MIRSVSYSKLIDFEQCKYRVKLKHIDKIPEEKSEAADRGTKIHLAAENYVRGKIKQLPQELRRFATEFEALRARYKAKQASLEGEWGFNHAWEPCDYKHAWLRVKADAVIHINATSAVVVDFKTGKSFGNEIKHGEQVQLYAIATLLRHPELADITVELWYLDVDQLVTRTMTRAQALRHLQPFEKRLVQVTKATEFPANPNIFSCKWCAYGPNKGGQCTFGVSSTGNVNLGNYRKRFG